MPLHRFLSGSAILYQSTYSVAQLALVVESCQGTAKATANIAVCITTDETDGDCYDLIFMLPTYLLRKFGKITVSVHS